MPASVDRTQAAMRAAPYLIALSATISLLAQDRTDRSFETGVNHVRVDMYPTVEGKTVTDLSQSEIELQEDGVPQKVAHFEHVFLSGPLRQPRMFRPGFSIVPARR